MAEDKRAVTIESVDAAQRTATLQLVLQRIDIKRRIDELTATKEGVDAQIAERFKALGITALEHAGSVVAVVASKGRKSLNKDLLKINLLGVGLDAGTVSDVLVKSTETGDAFTYVKVAAVKEGA
jgi:hypothetical protein